MKQQGTARPVYKHEGAEKMLHFIICSGSVKNK